MDDVIQYSFSLVIFRRVRVHRAYEFTMWEYLRALTSINGMCIIYTKKKKLQIQYEKQVRAEWI